MAQTAVAAMSQAIEATAIAVAGLGQWHAKEGFVWLNLRQSFVLVR